MPNRRASERTRNGAAPCACRSGFTLVEIAIVVLIIGILVAIAAVKLIDASGDANESSTRQSLAVIRNAIERYGKAPVVGWIPPLETLNRASLLEAFGSHFDRSCFD